MDGLLSLALAVMLMLLLMLMLAQPAACDDDARWRRRLVEVDTRGMGFEPRPLRRTLNPPPGLRNQAKEERLYLKLHKCKDAGEVYSAAYLIHKQHLLEQFTDYNLTWVNCEMGSFIMMNQRADPNKNINGSLTQTLDVLDFSVVHLSAYERLQRRWGGSIAKIVGKEVARQMHTGYIEPVVQATAMLKARALRRRGPGTPSPDPRLNRTVAIMPFLGSDNGAGHSILGNRKVYLQSCFWSLYAEFPHVVAAVKSPKDQAYARDADLGLPFFDVMLMPNLPKSASLPVSTVQWTKRRMQLGGAWEGCLISSTLQRATRFSSCAATPTSTPTSRLTHAACSCPTASYPTPSPSCSTTTSATTRPLGRSTFCSKTAVHAGKTATASATTGFTCATPASPWPTCTACRCPWATTTSTRRRTAPACSTRLAPRRSALNLTLSLALSLTHWLAAGLPFFWSTLLGFARLG